MPGPTSRTWLAQAAAVALETLNSPSPRLQAKALGLVRDLEDWQESLLASGRAVRDLSQELAIANAAEALVRSTMHLAPLLLDLPPQSAPAFAAAKETLAGILVSLRDPDARGLRGISLQEHRQGILDAGLATPWPRTPRSVLASSGLLHALEDLAEQASQASALLSPHPTPPGLDVALA